MDSRALIEETQLTFQPSNTKGRILLFRKDDTGAVPICAIIELSQERLH